jgi:UV DNA damage endonuclease
VKEALMKVNSTWVEKDGIPIVDYSSQAEGKRLGTHSPAINLDDFRSFLDESRGVDFDLMFEIKDKERSALKALKILRDFRK